MHLSSLSLALLHKKPVAKGKAGLSVGGPTGDGSSSNGSTAVAPKSKKADLGSKIFQLPKVPAFAVGAVPSPPVLAQPSVVSSGFVPTKPPKSTSVPDVKSASKLQVAGSAPASPKVAEPPKAIGGLLGYSDSESEEEGTGAETAPKPAGPPRPGVISAKPVVAGNAVQDVALAPKPAAPPRPGVIPSKKNVVASGHNVAAAVSAAMPPSLPSAKLVSAQLVKQVAPAAREAKQDSPPPAEGLLQRALDSGASVPLQRRPSFEEGASSKPAAAGTQLQRHPSGEIGAKAVTATAQPLQWSTPATSAVVQRGPMAASQRGLTSVPQPPPRPAPATSAARRKLAEGVAVWRAAQAAENAKQAADRDAQADVCSSGAAVAIDMRTLGALDGEELTAEELRPIAKKCGPAAWLWRVKNSRPAKKGLPLGKPKKSDDVLAVEADPDFEDFAFFAGIAAGPLPDGQGVGGDTALEEASGSSSGPLRFSEPVPPADPPAPTEPPPPPEQPAPPPEPSSSSQMSRQAEADRLKDAVRAHEAQRANEERAAEVERQRKEDEKRQRKELERDNRRKAEEAEKLREEERRKEDDRRRKEQKEEKRREEDRRREEKRREEDRRRDDQKREDELRREAVRIAEEKIRRRKAEEEELRIEEKRKGETEDKRRKAESQWVTECVDGRKVSFGPSQKRPKIAFGPTTPLHVAPATTPAKAEDGSLAALLRGQSSGEALAPLLAPAGGSSAAPDAAGQPSSRDAKTRRRSRSRTPPRTKEPPSAANVASKPAPVHGWMLEGSKCSVCAKNVSSQGGVICGRLLPGGGSVGCRASVCWKCMNKSPRESFGKVKTTKSEFISLGPDAWWMHERCMSSSDKRDYYGKDDAPSEKGGEAEARFAWE